MCPGTNSYEVKPENQQMNLLTDTVLIYYFKFYIYLFLYPILLVEKIKILLLDLILINPPKKFLYTEFILLCNVIYIRSKTEKS